MRGIFGLRGIKLRRNRMKIIEVIAGIVVLVAVSIGAFLIGWNIRAYKAMKGIR